MIFKKRHPKVGARPGTLMISEDAAPPRIEVISYTAERFEKKEISDIEQLADAIDSGAVNWIDVRGLGDVNLIRRLGEVFQIHPLALEDIVNVPQRPKAESYEDQLLLVARMVHAGESHNPIVEQVSFVLGKHYVLTVQEGRDDGDVFDPIRKRIKSTKGRHRQRGADYLLYTLADAVIDGYYPVLERVGDHLQSLEGTILDNPTPSSLQVLNHTRMELLNMRRGVWPQREAVHSLVHEESELLTPDVQLHLRDVYDHCVQTSEVIEMYREMASGLMGTYLSSVANRTNEIMRVLTIMGSIFIPLTFLAGVYGMNFEHMPELKVPWAYPAMLGVMIISTLGMVWFFRRKGWLGPQRDPDGREKKL